MPTLDVSDLLSDPDFYQNIQVTLKNVAIGDNGVGSSQISKVSATGVVVPITSEQLNRLPEGERLSGGVRIYTRYPLTAGGRGTTADQVVANRSEYIVVSVDSYEAFGGGFVVADCGLLSVRNSEPVPNTLC